MEEISKVSLNPSQSKLEQFTTDIKTEEKGKGKTPEDNDRLLKISQGWEAYKLSPFKRAGLMSKGEVWTCDYKAAFEGESSLLGDIIQKKVDDPWFYLGDDEIEQWKYLKGAKKEERIVKATGFKFNYTEGTFTIPRSFG
ncbi:MAG: hypothetical protein ACJZ37_00450 [Candidatus Poseidoniales archaeon]